MKNEAQSPGAPSSPAGRVEVSKRLLLINSASTVGTRLISLSVIVWLNSYLISKISAEEYSLLPVLYSVMMFAPLLTSVLTSGLSRYVIEAYARGDDERLTRITSTMAPILTGAGSVFLVCGLTFAWNVDHILDISPEVVWDARVIMAMLMFSTAIRLPFAPFGIGLHIVQRFVAINAIAIGTELFRLALLFTLLFCVSTRVLWVVTAAVSADLLYLMIIQIASMRAVPALRFRRASIHWPIARELTNFGSWNTLASLADTIRTSADPIILNKLATPVDVNCCYLGSLVTQKISLLSNAARGPMLPALTALHAVNDEARLQSMFLRGGRLALWIVLLPAMPLIIFHREVTILYAGEVYLQAGTVMVLSLLFLPLSYGVTMTTAIVNARGRIKTWALIAAAMNSVNLLLTLYLVAVQKMGAIGSASATLISAAIFYPLFVYPFSLRLVSVTFGRMSSQTLVPGILPAIASTVAGLVTHVFLEPDTWLELGLAAIPAVSAYGAALFFCLREDDRADLLRVGKKLRLTR